MHCFTFLPAILWLIVSTATAMMAAQHIHTFGRPHRPAAHRLGSQSAAKDHNVTRQRTPFAARFTRRSHRHFDADSSSGRCSSASRKSRSHPRMGAGSHSDGGKMSTTDQASPTGTGSGTSTQTPSHANGSGKRPHGHRKAPAGGGRLAGMTFSGPCPDPAATINTPNGGIHFLNCRISEDDPADGHWAPPNVTMDLLQFATLNAADRSGVFDACKPFDEIFQRQSDSTGVPAILLMSFAMQESSCDPSLAGDNGEIGMMQLTPEKCRNTDCYDPETNVDIAARYFRRQLDKSDGNVLQAIGTYNGWFQGMTYDQATDEQYGCFAQRNLDYLHQVLNGYCQAKDGSQMVIYDNLGHC